MVARGNKLSSCKISDQYLKKQKVSKLLELWQLWLKNEEKKIANTIELLSQLFKIANTRVMVMQH